MSFGTMTRNQINRFLLVILSTLAEIERGEAPSGFIFMALQTAGVTLDDYNFLVSILVKGEFVTVDHSHLIKITQRGRELLRQAGIL